jgi:hypothetical protein
MLDGQADQGRLKRDWFHDYIATRGEVLRTEIYQPYRERFHDEFNPDLRDSHVITVVADLRSAGDVEVTPHGQTNRIQHLPAACILTIGAA